MTAIKPIRIRLSRARGWRLPPNTIIVDRRSQWGNPWRVGPQDRTKPRMKYDCSTVEEAIRKYKSWLVDHFGGADIAERATRHLRGKNLACWCHIWRCPVCGACHDLDTCDAVGCMSHDPCRMVRVPCHADVLLELVNKE